MRIFGKVGDLIHASKAVKEASKILGKENVFSVGHGVIVPMYTLEQFSFAATENREGRHWNLCYINTTSLENLRQQHPKEFAASSLWEKPPRWVRRNPEPGYRLLDFHLTPLEKVEERKRNLEKMGVKCSPAQVVTIAQAMIAMKKTSPIQHLVRVYHWGERIAGTEKIPIIGLDGANGLFIQTIPFVPASHPIFRQSRLGDEGNIRSMGVVLCMEPPLVNLSSQTSTT